MTHHAFTTANIYKSHSQWATEAMQAERAEAWKLAAHCWRQACNTTLSVRRSAEYGERMTAALNQVKEA